MYLYIAVNKKSCIQYLYVTMTNYMYCYTQDFFYAFGKIFLLETLFFIHMETYCVRVVAVKM